MRRQDLFAPLSAAQILYEDEHIVAVNKPAGVPAHPTVEGAEDDIVSRTTAYFAERDGKAPKLGVHHHLGADMSGVLVFGLHREANRGLAPAFEAGAVRPTFLAAVHATGRPKGVLKHRVGFGADGTVVCDPKGRGKRWDAVTRFDHYTTKDGRALVSLVIERGKRIQFGAQLAQAEMPVVGDRPRGVSAPHPYLHAHRLDLAHPVSDVRLSLTAPLPDDMSHWLATGEVHCGADRIDVALQAAAHRRYGLGRQAQAGRATTAFRLLHGASDGVPGVYLDVYGDHLVLSLHGSQLTSEPDEIIAALSSTDFAGVYLKRRPKRSDTLSDAERADLSPATPVCGAAAPAELEIREAGVPYLVRLGDGMSTGIFLDQRDNRARVTKAAEGRALLNLFAYTGGFTVAAAAGGAERSLTVDASEAALERARRNLEHAGLWSDKHELVRADAFAMLSSLRRDGLSFDLVVVDPPTFATTKASRWKSGGQWRDLFAAVLPVVKPGGTLWACSNDTRMSARDLRQHFDAAWGRGAGHPKVRARLPPQDFPTSMPGPHLKTLEVSLP